MVLTCAGARWFNDNQLRRPTFHRTFGLAEMLFGGRTFFGHRSTRLPEPTGTRTRLLTPDDIQGWSLANVRYAINEMYARRGADFRDKEIKNWFSQFSWYNPEPGRSYDDVETEFTEIETQNVKLLGDYRNSH
jgi:hypothetical protein